MPSPRRKSSPKRKPAAAELPSCPICLGDMGTAHCADTISARPAAGYVPHESFNPRIRSDASKQVVSTPCRHCMHWACGMELVEGGDTKCPTCRQELPEAWRRAVTREYKTVLIAVHLKNGKFVLGRDDDYVFRGSGGERHDISYLRNFLTEKGPGIRRGFSRVNQPDGPKSTYAIVARVLPRKWNIGANQAAWDRTAKAISKARIGQIVEVHHTGTVVPYMWYRRVWHKYGARDPVDPVEEDEDELAYVLDAD